MIIRKRYNVEQLAEQLQTEIENSKKYNRVVKLDILTANDILDVLNETNKREQKHQTLESACTFMEMEDGTQTNEMELHNKKDANGNTLRSMNCHSKVLNRTQTNDRVPGCYGCYYDKGLYCPDCKSRESCVQETINRENIEEDDDFI